MKVAASPSDLDLPCGMLAPTEARLENLMEQEATLTLRDLLTERGITMEAAGLLAGVTGSTISRIASGQSRATPKTVVKLAKALGVNALRMRSMCDAHYLAAHPDELVLV